MAVVALFILPVLWGARRARLPLAARGKGVTRAWAEVAAAVEESLRHAAVVAAFGCEVREAKRCGAALRTHVGAVRNQARLEAVIGAGVFYAQSVSLVGVVWFGTREARRDTSLPGFLSPVYYTTEAASAEKVTITCLNRRAPREQQRGRDASERTAASAAVADNAINVSPSEDTFVPALEFRGVSLAFPNASKPALDDGSRRGRGTISSGSPSGGGKSTIMKVVRLVTPESGAYLLGVDALRVPVDVIRRKIGWVPQAGLVVNTG